MALREEVERDLAEKARREEENPLLKLSLGDLIARMITMGHEDGWALRYQKTLDWGDGRPKVHLEYEALVQEINRREKEYTKPRSLDTF